MYSENKCKGGMKVMYKCPHPDCSYVATHAILNSHARTHGFNKVADLVAAHGPITSPKIDPRKLRSNMEKFKNLNPSDYNNIEQAMFRMNKSDRGNLSNEGRNAN